MQYTITSHQDRLGVVAYNGLIVVGAEIDTKKVLLIGFY